MSTPINATDLWQMKRVGQPIPHPSGRFAIVPVTTYDLETDKGTTRLWHVETDGTRRPLTGSSASSTKPALSPAGDLVAFLRSPQEGERKQLHVIPLSGGEAENHTSLPLGVAAARWLPDGSGLVLAVPLFRDHQSIEATQAEVERRDDKPTRPVVTEDRIYRFWKKWLVDGEIHHLFHLHLESGALTDLTPDLSQLIALDDPEPAFDISPDGREVAFAADICPPPHDRFQFAIHTVPITGESPTRLLPEEHLPAHQTRPRYSPDGRYITYGIQQEHDYYAAPVELVRHDRDSGQGIALAPNWDRSAGGWEYTADGDLVVHATDEGSMAVFLLTEGATTPTPIVKGVYAHGPRPTTGPLWLRTESAEYPAEVTIVDEDGMHVIGTFNDDVLAGLDLGTIDEFSFAGADGHSIQAHIVYPPGFDPQQKWPLVHNIHGGPHNASGGQWHWRWNTQLFAAGGYVVASVNFHGSDSFSDEFTRSIRGAWGDKPMSDIMAATDHLIDQGFIDQDRIAIAGGSYGGYLVSWLTSQTDRFVCAVCHAGVTDLLGQWASDITAGRETAIGGTPWDDMDAVLRWSPLANTSGMNTPTLVVHGELDYRVVVTQGLSLYGILKHKGVDARLVYYPDEGHWIETPSNSIHWYGEVADWLARYLGDGSE